MLGRQANSGQARQAVEAKAGWVARLAGLLAVKAGNTPWRGLAGYTRQAS